MKKKGMQNYFSISTVLTQIQSCIIDDWYNILKLSLTKEIMFLGHEDDTRILALTFFIRD